MHTIIISVPARADITRNYDYLCEINPDSALKFFDATRSTFAEIARNPEIGISTLIMDKTPRISIPDEVRKYVFDRDRNKCLGCGKTDLEAKLTIDHIEPLAQGGSNDLSNLQTLCGSCNSSKRDRPDPRFRRRFT